MKKQTSIVAKQYQGLNKFYESDKMEGDNEKIKKEEKDDDKTRAIERYNKINLIYNSKHSF